MVARANTELSNMRTALMESAAEQPPAARRAQPCLGQRSGTDAGAQGTSDDSSSNGSSSSAGSSVESGAVPLLTPAQASALVGCLVLATLSSLAGTPEALAAPKRARTSEPAEGSQSRRKRARLPDAVACSPVELCSGTASPDSAALPRARVQCTLPCELLADFDTERALYGHGIACPDPAMAAAAAAAAAAGMTVAAAAPVAAVPGLLDAGAYYDVAVAPAVLPCESVCSSGSEIDESEDGEHSTPLFHMVVDDTLTADSFDFC